MSIENANTFLVGDIVQSQKGRDEGCYYVVCSTDKDYAYCVNGKSRLVANPKKKKFKHILFTGHRSSELQKKFNEHQKVLDSEIRKTIDNLNIV